MKEYIYNVIAKRKTPISRLRLAQLTGMNDRDVRKHIEELRLEGFPICSKKGYFIPSTPSQAQEFVTTMKAKVKSLNKMIKAVERSTIIELGKQFTIKNVWGSHPTPYYVSDKNICQKQKKHFYKGVEN